MRTRFPLWILSVVIALPLVASPQSAVIDAALDHYLESRCGSGWENRPTLVSDLSIEPHLSASVPRTLIPEDLLHQLSGRPLAVLELPDLRFPFRVMNATERDRLGRAWDPDTLRELRAEGGLIRFSEPVFDAQKTQALVYMTHACGNLCAEGRLLYFEHRHGRWQLMLDVPLWIS